MTTTAQLLEWPRSALGQVGMTAPPQYFRLPLDRRNDLDR